MRNNKSSKKFEWVDTNYRVSRHHSSGLIELEELVPNGFWGRHQMVWKRIYFGHPNPLQEALNFYSEGMK